MSHVIWICEFKMLLFTRLSQLSYSEILRVIDSVQLTAKFKVATPADWQVYIYEDKLMNLVNFSNI